MSKKIIVVGGVAGGATSLARLRRLSEDAEIILIEKGEFVSFANCGLPYYIGGVIKNREALFVSDIKSIEGKYGVEIRNFSELIGVDSDKKQVLIKNVKTGDEYYESYDSLLLSTGSYPFVPKMDGIENKNVFTLWNIPDTDKIYNYINENKVKRALIAGGGFVGIELAENLRDRGIEVTLVEFSDQILGPLDKDMAKIVENHVLAKGVDLRLKTGLKSIKENGRLAEFSDGNTLKTDMIVLSIGVRPNTGFLQDTKVKLNDRGGVVVDQYMRTSVEDIYAVGDMIEVTHNVSGEQTMIPLAGIANKQGRAVAANILGLKKEPFKGAIGTSIVKVFDFTVATTGENEKALEKRGLKLWKDYGVSLIHPMSHAGYYPGALPMNLKLIFSLDDGRILGGQIVGYDGVDKRIDTIATSMYFKANVYDLSQIELAYAPPFSSAKDPVNMAGYYATNILEGLTKPITYKEFVSKRDSYTLLDIREKIEISAGSIPGSMNIPLTELRDRFKELDKSKEYVVYCAIGLRGYIAERILVQKGYKLRNLLGGYLTYIELDSDFARPTNLHIDQDKLPEENTSDQVREVLELDVCGLSCPGPIVSVSKKMQELKMGNILQVRATDPGFARDIENWCINTSNTLESKSESKGVWTVNIKKGQDEASESPSSGSGVNTSKEKTMIVFDGDLDKAIAAFIIANGALAMGNKVNMFFTFWGLNILRKKEKLSVKKDFMGKMFGGMMPRGASKLGLSKMNFMGAGSKMMKGVMKKKGISSLEELMKDAIDNGAKIIACQMSMDVMGITKEELIDGVEVGGVATMLNDNDRSNMNLFI